MKKSETLNKFFDLVRKLNMNVTVNPQKSEKYIQWGRIETIQTRALKLARILRKVLEIWSNLLSLSFQWKNYHLAHTWKVSRKWIVFFLAWYLQYIYIYIYKGVLFYVGVMWTWDPVVYGTLLGEIMIVDRLTHHLGSYTNSFHIQSPHTSKIR